MKEKVKHYWLYVLKLEQGKWYVGITSKTPEKRMRQHKNGFAGARWTQKYKPIKVHDSEFLGGVSIEKAQEYEGRVTRKYMEEYGDNNVRGGDLTDTDDYVRHFGRIFAKEGWSDIGMVLFLLGVILALGVLYYLK